MKVNYFGLIAGIALLFSVSYQSFTYLKNRNIMTNKNISADCCIEKECCDNEKDNCCVEKECCNEENVCCDCRSWVSLNSVETIHVKSDSEDSVLESKHYS